MKTNLKKLLESTGRKLYIDEKVLKTAPSKPKGKYELEFFNLGKWISDDDLKKEYISRGLIPADIETLVEHSKEVDEKEYVGIPWKDKQGRWCYTAFDRWYVGPSVRVYRSGYEWYGYWWFAGLRKSGSRKLESSDSPSSELRHFDIRLLALEARIKRLEDWRKA